MPAIAFDKPEKNPVVVLGVRHSLPRYEPVVEVLSADGKVIWKAPGE